MYRTSQDACKLTFTFFAKLLPSAAETAYNKCLLMDRKHSTALLFVFLYLHPQIDREQECQALTVCCRDGVQGVPGNG